MTNSERGTYTLRLINNAGQVVFGGTLKHNGGSVSQTLQVNTDLQKGVYQLEIISEKGNKEIIKIIK
jgi:hypothetical protein